MTVPRCKHLLLAACLVLATIQSHAQLDPDANNNLNVFTIPGYSAGGTPRTPASTPGQSVNGAGNGSSSGPNTRGLQNNPATNNVRNNNTASDNAPRRFEPPPKPSEFQKFVEAATGRLLPAFGASFFRQSADVNFNANGNAASSALDNVPVSADYTIGPGDEIVLRAWGSIDIDYRSTVDRNGMLNLPKIGSFSVAGVKASELEKHLQTQIGRLFTNFSLSASLGQLRGLKVFVVGPALRPGVQNLPSQSTLLSAVVAAGGPSPSGSMRKVQLRRDNRIISELDVYDFLVQGDKSKDVQLAAGDVVVFQPVGPRVAINGALDTPSIFELKTPQEPVSEVLRYAGGTPNLANPNRAQLERIDVAQPTAARFVETFPLDAGGLQKTLRDGDILTLLEISPQFANAVTLRGHVAQPLRYPFKPGMRIRDLIPDRDALISPDYYRRKNLIVQVLSDQDEARARRRAQQLHQQGGAYGAAVKAPDDAASSSNRGYRSRSNTNGSDDRTADRSDDRGNDRYDDSADAATDSQDGASASSSSTRRNNDDTRRRNDQMLNEEPVRKPPTPLFDELNWDYAVIERLNTKDLSTQVIPFNLGKAILQGDDASNVALMPGDVVTIYGQKDIRVPVSRQTRLVSVEGEIASPGVYQLQAGDTLQTLIQRAGGFTPQAYVYGLEFSREETKKRQRENIAEAITRLQSVSAVQAARDAANRRDDAVGAQSTTIVSNAATQAQVARLRSIQPNGRIALELSPDAQTLAALPPVPLEAGDRVVIPPRPGFVTVAGAVVNSNAFLWRPGRTAGEYLRLAGADEAAEPENMFILRADGTVSHAGDNRSFFGRNSLESQVMQPGDALIVPTQLDFETWGRATIRNLKDFATIFSGFGIGIAAVHTINN
jgi:protein involved in polysaccharide export with SLBB domain